MLPQKFSAATTRKRPFDAVVEAPQPATRRTKSKARSDRCMVP